MSRHSRRAFLAWGGGVAAATAAAAVSPAALAHAPDDAPARGRPSPDGPVVVYVRDVTTGEVAVMSGDREVVVTDHDLVTRLVRKLG